MVALGRAAGTGSGGAGGAGARAARQHEPARSFKAFAGDETRPNLTVVKVGVNDTIDLYTSTSTHVVLDVAGWFS